MKIWQRLVQRWSFLTFREHSSRITPRIRMFRLLEETLELSQAEGVDLADVYTIVDQVYSRPTGQPHQELGGVIVCAVAYAACAGYDLEEAFWSEFERIMDPAMMEKVRTRNLSGDKIGMQE